MLPLSLQLHRRLTKPAHNGLCEDGGRMDDLLHASSLPGGGPALLQEGEEGWTR